MHSSRNTAEDTMSYSDKIGAELKIMAWNFFVEFANLN